MDSAGEGALLGVDRGHGGDLAACAQLHGHQVSQQVLEVGSLAGRDRLDLDFRDLLGDNSEGLLDLMSLLEAV